MLPLLLGVPVVMAATADLTTYAVGVALLGAGGLVGYWWRPEPSVPERSYDESARERSYLSQAESLRVEARKGRRQVLENLGEEATEALERVLEQAHQSRLKLGSLSSDFAARAEEMEKTNQILRGLIKILEEGDIKASEKIAYLSSELEGLKKMLAETHKKFGKTISSFLGKTKRLQEIIENFSRLQSELEMTQLEYREQITNLTHALEQANIRLNHQQIEHASQDEHIHALQKKVEQLTGCLQMATEKGEAYAKALSCSRLENQSQAEEIKRLRVLSEDVPNRTKEQTHHRTNRFF